MSESTHDHDSEPPRRSRRRSRRPGPRFATIWFSVLGVIWIGFTFVALDRWRPHPLGPADYAVGALGCLFGCFYFFVASAVYHRRKYIFDVALVCAGLGILAFPLGTLISLLLISNIAPRRHDFTK